MLTFYERSTEQSQMPMNRKQRRAAEKGHQRAASLTKKAANAASSAPHGIITGVNADRKTIGLCMIVKNESKVILRCLESVRPLVDYVLIEDTGSTDGTQTIIREWLDRAGLPGEVYDEPWRDFAYNRSHALARLRNNKNVDYALIIDADDVLELPPGFKMPRLKADSYTLEIWHKELRYWRTQLVRNALPWRYEGVLHEFLSCPVGPDNRRTFPEERSQQRLPGVRIRMSEEGARRQISASERYRRDAAVLESALATETDPFLISRYTFYLAQSYRDCREREKALVNYLKRAELGNWDQEVFISLYQAANLKADLGYDAEDVLATYLRAHNVRKDRAEALHGAARYCRVKERFEQGYKFAQRALAMKAPTDGLNLEQWVYDYGVLDEYAVNAYWTDKYAECVNACDRLLSEGRLPREMHDRVLKNKASAVGKLREAATLKPLEADVFIKLLRAAREKEQIAGPDDEVLSAYVEASAACPTRAEALHGAARFCRNKGMHERGYQFAAQGLAIAYPKDAPGIEDWIYEYGLLDELAVCAYWTGRYKECADACDRLLTEGKLPTEQRDRILKNKQFAIDKVQEAAARPPATDNQRVQVETARLQETVVSEPGPPRAAKENSPALGQPKIIPVPASEARRHAQEKRSMSNSLHVLGVAHTVPHEDYLVCAFTSKVLLFPEVIQPFGWDVIEYSNEGSASKAREHVVILTKERLRALSQRRSREEPLDADVNNKDLQNEFQRVLLEKIRSRAKPGDIVCHVWGPNWEVYNHLRDCHHIELCVGYTASPGLPFRIYESSAWMHWHYGKAGQEDGNHYKWVIPSPIDVDKWVFCEKPDDYAIFLGRVTPTKRHERAC